MQHFHIFYAFEETYSNVVYFEGYVYQNMFLVVEEKKRD